MKGRFLTHLSADGLWNMAVDAALARVSEADLVLRCYSWTPWTLSLGHAQNWDDVLAERARGLGIPVVRRETGGRAVYHAEELTYCVCIPAKSPLHEGNLQKAYSRINKALGQGISALGVRVEQESRKVNLREAYRKEMGGLCFTATAQSEVLWDNRKLIGSAQRQLREGLLQHGSLMTGPAHEDIVEIFFEKDALKQAARDKLRRQTCSLSEALGTEIDFHALARSLKKAFEEEFDLQLEASELSSREQDLARQWSDSFKPETGSVRLPAPA